MLPRGLEPWTSRLLAERSNQLSYESKRGVLDAPDIDEQKTKITRGKSCRTAINMTPVGFEPTPLRTGALSQRLRPLGQSVLRIVRLWTQLSQGCSQ